MVRSGFKYWLFLITLSALISANGGACGKGVASIHSNNFINSDQTTCSEGVPAPLNGTVPVGGIGTYTYEWQFSSDNTTYLPAPGVSSQQNYTFPSGLTSDTWYRRLVSSTGCPTDTVVSDTVMITVVAAPCSERLIGLSTLVDEYGNDIIVDPVNQFVYTVGAFEDFSLFPGFVQADMNLGNGNGNLDGFLVKLDYNGNVLWAVNMGGAGNDEAMALTLAPNGNIYVTGYFDDVIRFKSVSGGFSTLSPMNQEDVFVAAYDPSGNLQFSASGGGANSDWGMGITSNSSGVYVTGVYENVASFGSLTTESTFSNVINGFIVKYSYSGAVQWLVEMKSPGDERQLSALLRDAAYDIASDDGNVYAVGYMGGNNMRFVDSSGTLLTSPNLNGTGNSPNTFICSFDTAGALNWGVVVDDPSPNKRGFGIDVDCDGVYVATNIHNNGVFPSGTVINTLTHDNPVLMKLDLTTGIDQWLAILGSNNPTNHVEVLHDIKADGFGNLYISGYYGANDFFTPDTVLAPAQGLDGFIGKFSNTGNFEWARSLNGNGDDAVYAVAVSGQDYMFLTGGFEGEVRLAPDTLNGSNDINLLLGKVKVDSSGVGTLNCCSVVPVGGTVTASQDSICIGDSVNLTLQGSSGTIQWEISTDSGATWSTIPAANSPSITTSPTQSSEYRAVVSGVSPLCIPDTSTVVSIRVDAIPTPANAGPDQNLCGNTSAVFAGNAPTVGVGIWALETGMGIPSLPNDPNSPVSGLNSGPNTFVWKISNGSCPTSTDTVMLTVLTTPVVKLGNDTLVCFGDSLTLFADPGGLYPGAAFSWSTGDTTDTLLVTSAGTYTVEVDSGGCIGRDTIMINFAASPTAILPADTRICDGSFIVLNADPNGLNLGASFSWSTGDTTSNISVDTTGLYYVDIFYANCPSTSDTIQITSIQIPIVDLGVDTLVCGGDSILLNADSGGLYPGAGFLWSTGELTTTINVFTAGTYFVEIDTAGCIGSDTISIGYTPIPVAILPGDTSICAGDSILLDADPNGLNAGAAFSWSTGETSPAIVAGSGQYAVDISYAGCTPASDTILISSALPLVVDLGPDTVLCQNDSLVLNADPGGLYPGATYSWSGGGTTQVLIAGTGMWSVVLTDANGCSGTDSITISAANLNLSFIGLDSNFCVNAPPVQLFASPSGGTFSGSGIAGSTFDPNNAGIGTHLITYTYTDGNGCTGSTQGTTTVDLGETADAGPDREIYFTDQATLQGNSPSAGFGVWGVVTSSGELEVSTNPATTVTGLDIGPNTFSWTIINNGCQSTDEVTLIRHPFIPEQIFTPNGDNYNDFFVVPGLQDYPGSRMEIFTRWGERIFASENYQNDWQGNNQSGQALQDDTYFYVLTLSSGEVIKGYVELKR